jgi:hypothetical protein
MDAAVAMGGTVSAALAALIVDAPDGAILEQSRVCGGCARGRGTAGRAGRRRRCSSTMATPRRALAARCRRYARTARSMLSPCPARPDLTAHVDFAAMAETAEAGGARWMGTAEQGPWLHALRIGARAQALARSAPAQVATLNAALDRLTGESQMGALFKVMGLANPGWPAGAGFLALGREPLPGFFRRNPARPPAQTLVNPRFPQDQNACWQTIAFASIRPPKWGFGARCSRAPGPCARDKPDGPFPGTFKGAS